MSGKVLDERGSPPVDPAAVLAWGVSALRDTAGIDDLDDLIVTGRLSYHLVRCATPDGGPSVLVYVCLERSRANLALARRALAGLSWARPGTATGPGPSASPASPASSVPRTAAPRTAAQTPRPAAPRAGGDPVRVPGRPAGAAAARPDRGAEGATGGAEPPQQVPAPRPPSALPLPRRTPAPVRPADPGPARPSPVGARWAHDVGTMRRLLAGLRALK